MKTVLINPWLLPVLSGIFIGTSYIPFPPWASVFGFIPLWIFWEQQTRLRAVILGGILTSFVFTLIGFNWVTYLLHEFAHVYGAGVGEYYNLYQVRDTTGEQPLLNIDKADQLQ